MRIDSKMTKKFYTVAGVAMISKKTISTLVAFLLVLIQVSPAMAAPAAPLPVGVFVAGALSLNGVSVPAGTTIFSESTLTTGKESATVYFQSQQAIRLNEESTAVVGTSESGSLVVTVSSGSVSYRDANGMLAMAGPNSLIEFAEPQQPGGVGRGQPTPGGAGGGGGGGGLGAFFGNPWLLGALVAAAIAVPLAVTTGGDEEPASPITP